MKQKSMGHPVWAVFKAPLIYWVINLAISFGSVFVYAYLHSDLIRSVGQDMEAMSKLAYKIYGEIIQYSLEMSLAAALLMLPIAWSMFKKDKVGQQNIVGVKANFGEYGILICFSIIFSIVTNNLLILSRVASISPGYQSASEVIYSSSFLLQIICAGIVIPLVEELIYRGLVYKRLLVFMKKSHAMCFSAFIFGFMHGNVVQFIYAFLVGILLCLFYEKFDSLKGPVVAHIIINSTSLVASKLGIFTWVFMSPLRMGIVTVVGACLGAVLYVFMRPAKASQSLEESIDE